jgi:hypothetical protein
MTAALRSTAHCCAESAAQRAWGAWLQDTFITDFLAASALPAAFILSAVEAERGTGFNSSAGLYAVLLLRLLRFARQAVSLIGLLDQPCWTLGQKRRAAGACTA